MSLQQALSPHPHSSPAALCYSSVKCPCHHWTPAKLPGPAWLGASPSTCLSAARRSATPEGEREAQLLTRRSDTRPHRCHCKARTRATNDGCALESAELPVKPSPVILTPAPCGVAVTAVKGTSASTPASAKVTQPEGPGQDADQLAQPSARRPLTALGAGPARTASRAWAGSAELGAARPWHCPPVTSPPVRQAPCLDSAGTRRQMKGKEATGVARPCTALSVAPWRWQHPARVTQPVLAACDAHALSCFYLALMSTEHDGDLVGSQYKDGRLTRPGWCRACHWPKRVLWKVQCLNVGVKG